MSYQPQKRKGSSMGRIPPNPRVPNRYRPPGDYSINPDDITTTIKKSIEKIDQDLVLYTSDVEVPARISDLTDEELLEKAVSLHRRWTDLDYQNNNIYSSMVKLKEPEKLENGLAEWKNYKYTKEEMERLSNETIRTIKNEISDIGEDYKLLHIEMRRRPDIPNRKWIKVGEYGIYLDYNDNMRILSWKDVIGKKEISKPSYSEGELVVGFIGSGLIILLSIIVLKIVGLFIITPVSLLILWALINKNRNERLKSVS